MGGGLTRLPPRAKTVVRLLAVGGMVAMPVAAVGAPVVGGATVMTESVLVYAQTSTRSPVVTSLKRGTPVSVDVTIARPDGDWCRITVESETTPIGFVRCGALDPVPVSRITPSTPAPPAVSPSLGAPVTVPIHVTGNLAVVSVALERRQMAFLLIDSGASATIITPVMLRLLGLTMPPSAPRRELAVIGGRKIEVPFVRLSSLSVGSALIRDIEVGVYDIAPQAPVVDGLLGGDVLHRFSATVDAGARRLRLMPLTRPPR